MATDNELTFLGRSGIEQLVANVKALLATKQDKKEDNGGVSVFVDRTTNKKYVLYVDNGELRMKEDNSLSGDDVSTFIDQTTGAKYVLYVNGGKLHMEAASN